MCLPKDAKGSTIQSVATLVASLLCLNTGIIFGISTPHAQLYQQRDSTPLNRPIDEAAATCVISYLFLGATVSALFAGAISNRIGPKSVLLLSGLLQITSWFCIHFGFDIMHIYASRLFAGIAAGAAFTVLPIFITEITDDCSDRLVIYTEQARSLGIFAGVMLGLYMPYMYVAIVGVVISSIFSLTFPFVQESPYYYLRKGNMSSFEKSLRWYRGIRDIDDRERPEFVREINALKETVTKQQSTIAKYRNHHYALKVFVLCLLITLCAHVSGAYMILSYIMELLPVKPATSEFPAQPIDAIWLLAGAHWVGAYLSTFVLRHIKRKLSFIVAGVICSLSLITLALSKLLSNTFALNAGQFYSIQFTSLALNLIASNMALFPLASIISVDLLPPKVRSTIISIAFSLCWLLNFLLIHYYNNLVWFITVTGCYWLLAACSVTLIILFLLFVPETQYKSTEELQHRLGYGFDDVIPKITTISNGRVNDAFSLNGT